MFIRLHHVAGNMYRKAKSNTKYEIKDNDITQNRRNFKLEPLYSKEDN